MTSQPKRSAGGAAGPANTLTIGTVDSGSTAAATITGTSPNQVLNLTFPSGGNPSDDANNVLSSQVFG